MIRSEPTSLSMLFLLSISYSHDKIHKIFKFNGVLPLNICNMLVESTMKERVVVGSMRGRENYMMFIVDEIESYIITLLYINQQGKRGYRCGIDIICIINFNNILLPLKPILIVGHRFLHSSSC